MDAVDAAGRSAGAAADQDGFATIPHAARQTYSMGLQAAGFQVPESLKVTPSPDATTTLTLTHARPPGAGRRRDARGNAGGRCDDPAVLQAEAAFVAPVRNLGAGAVG